MYYLISSTTIAIIIIIFWLKNKRSKSLANKLLELQASWGLQNDDERSFELIGLYMRGLPPVEKILSNEVKTDLDTERLFSYIDRTKSRPGQQYLFKKLHEPDSRQDVFSGMEKMIDKLTADQDLRDQIRLKLSELDDGNAYYLPELFFKKQQLVFNSITQWYIRIAGILVIGLTIALILTFQKTILVLLLVLLIGNLFIHITNKKQILRYTRTIPQLLILINVGQWLSKKEGTELSDRAAKSLSQLLKLKRSLKLVNVQSAVARDPTEIVYLVFEWLNILFLIEPIIFIISIKKLNAFQSDIQILFECIAEIDMLISIQSFREGLPYYCLPDHTGKDSLSIQDLYHPLIEDCVSNSIKINKQQGALITGSNMSGKTTFIRALACNTLLSQTIHTCCARSYQGPFLKILTSINISDDLSENKSYFQAEALSVLNIIERSSGDKSSTSLIIIDEIFRGTNTIERIASAEAVLEHLIGNHNFVFVSTHDLELADLLASNYHVFSFAEQVVNDQLIFDYKIKEGLLKKTNGIPILKVLGYPQSIIAQAYRIDGLLRKKYDL